MDPVDSFVRTTMMEHWFRVERVVADDNSCYDRDNIAPYASDHCIRGYYAVFSRQLSVAS